ncbi:hypothetical protein J1605_021013, partial [Eschrichtius robustus]
MVQPPQGVFQVPTEKGWDGTFVLLARTCPCPSTSSPEHLLPFLLHDIGTPLDLEA